MYFISLYKGYPLATRGTAAFYEEIGDYGRELVLTHMLFS